MGLVTEFKMEVGLFDGSICIVRSLESTMEYMMYIWSLIVGADDRLNDQGKQILYFECLEDPMLISNTVYYIRASVEELVG